VSRMVLISLVALIASTGTARAQDATRWGISGSLVPSWTMAKQLSDLLVAVDPDADSSSVDIRGSEFRIGFVRGRELGGDWGVSFVRKQLRSGSHVAESRMVPLFDDRGRYIGDGPEGFAYDLEGATLTGVEYHRFRPFTTIKERVQIGLTYGGGIGQLAGYARGVESGAGGTRAVERPVDALFDDGEVGLLSVVDYTLKPVPLAKFELTVAGLVAPGLKVRASGGFNVPGYEVGSISLVYLFGSR
jgi:hypothetical protein